MLNEAIKKIEKQQSGKGNTAAYMVGEQLKDICRESTALAEIVSRDLDVQEMSIDKAERKIKEWADGQRKVGSCVYVPPDVAEGIIRDFYGLPKRVEKTGKSNEGGLIDLANFL